MQAVRPEDERMLATPLRDAYLDLQSCSSDFYSYGVIDLGIR
jgi:hypothetical protein